METNFFYELLQWIRARKKQLAEQTAEGALCSGLSPSLTRALFDFERAHRGIAPALRQFHLPADASAAQARTGPDTWGGLPRAARANLKHRLAALAQHLREQPNRAAPLLQELLDLPTPPVQETVSAERAFFRENLARLEKQLATKHPGRFFSLHLSEKPDGFSCDLRTFTSGPPRVSYRWAPLPHDCTAPLYRTATIRIPYAQGATLGEWLAGMTKGWRMLQAEADRWFQDEALWPSAADIKNEEIEQLRTKLRQALTEDERRLLRENTYLL